MGVRGALAALRGHIYAAALHLLTLVLAGALHLAIAGVASYAQAMPIQCPPPDVVWNFIVTLQTMVLIMTLVILLFTFLFSMFGHSSSLLMRLGEFFSERLRFVFELVVIYVFFLMGFTPEMVGVGSGGQCASVNAKLLFESGPVFFRLIGLLLKLIGIQY